MQLVLTYGVNIIAIILVIVSMYFNAKRYNNIFSLPTSVINKKVKADNLKKLSNNRYVKRISTTTDFLKCIFLSTIYNYGFSDNFNLYKCVLFFKGFGVCFATAN